MTNPPSPWDSEDALPPKPDGLEYGFLHRRTVYNCTREDLVKVCGQTTREILLVATPDSPRFVIAWDVPFLADAVRRRSLEWLKQRAQVSGFVTLGLGALAATNFKSRSFAVFAAVAVFMGLLPLIWALRTRRQLIRGTFNAAAMSRLTKFRLWTRARPQAAAWILAGALALAGAWQMAVGLHRSLEFAGHLKNLAVNGEPWRVLTGGLIHAGFLHFGLNVLALLTLGRIVESLASRWHVFLIFMVSILAGGLASQVLNDYNTVGASGGILGLLGFLSVFAMRRPGALPASIRNWIVLMIVGVVALGAAAPGLIDNAGHGGGLVGGALLGVILILRRSPVIPVRANCTLVALGAVSLAIVVATVLALPVATAIFN